MAFTVTMFSAPRLPRVMERTKHHIAVAAEMSQAKRATPVCFGRSRGAKLHELKRSVVRVSEGKDPFCAFALHLACPPLLAALRRAGTRLGENHSIRTLPRILSKRAAYVRAFSSVVAPAGAQINSVTDSFASPFLAKSRDACVCHEQRIGGGCKNSLSSCRGLPSAEPLCFSGTFSPAPAAHCFSRLSLRPRSTDTTSAPGAAAAVGCQLPYSIASRLSLSLFSPPAALLTLAVLLCSCSQSSSISSFAVNSPLQPSFFCAGSATSLLARGLPPRSSCVNSRLRQRGKPETSVQSPAFWPGTSVRLEAGGLNSSPLKTQHASFPRSIPVASASSVGTLSGSGFFPGSGLGPPTAPYSSVASSSSPPVGDSLATTARRPASSASSFASSAQLFSSVMAPPASSEAVATGGVSAGSATTTETVDKTSEQHVVLKPTKQPVEKHRLDYKPPEFLVDFVDLDFDLHDDRTKVTSTLTMHRRPGTEPTNLVLDGEDLDLESVELDGVSLHSKSEKDAKETYSLDVDGRLIVEKKYLPAEAEKKFKVKTVVYIRPKENLQLMGLYKSGSLLVTQCEAEGFRRITYFLDRPDVMSLYKVRLVADEKSCPVLLSNGNLVDSGKVQETPGRHFAVFEDPFHKPCYLFALVAGDLKSIQDTFTTKSGRRVRVAVFSEPEDSSKLTWALQSVLKAMKWDEDRFGREYDLDVFNVVCAKDFNMGAMENKGLNIFNAALLLADPKTTTDGEYQRILNVVGHEYFHNWTGNRVTCRDWFQLTLKEGLTVFRDQLFTADMCSAAVKRIEDVTFVRSRQFAEDSGPMAHPIRPESYIAMDNFYTATVYDKGAEVIRMYHTLLGEEGFRKGMDLYFKRHDGQAVTCDDFRAAMADANKRDLTQFEQWYLQAGTPHVEVLEASYSPEKKTYTLRLKQHTPPTPGQPTKKPFHIPIKIGLIGKESKTDLLKPPTKVLELCEEEQTFQIPDVGEDCVLSFLRDFSAPIKVKFDQQSDSDIAFLMAHDSDDFAKWQAAHTVATKILRERAEVWSKSGGSAPHFKELPKTYVDAFRATLLEEGRDKSIQAYTLRLPDRDSLAQDMEPIDPEALREAAESVRKEISKLLYDDLMKVYKSLTTPDDQEETREQADVARRRLRNVILYFLTAEKDEKAADLAMNHFLKAKGMTDKFSALVILADIDSPQRHQALEKFYEDAQGDALVIDKWFAVQALSELPGVVETVRKLQKHPDFTAKNPNRLRALVFSFTRNFQFHNKDGKGYELLADCVLEVDSFNPQIAARAAGAFLQWKKYDEERQKLMVAQLRRIQDAPGLSPDTLEIVQKALAGVQDEKKD